MIEARDRLRAVLFAIIAAVIIGGSVLPMAFWTSKAIGLW